MTEKSYPRLENGVVIYGPADEKPQPESEPLKVEVKVDARGPLKPRTRPKE